MSVTIATVKGHTRTLAAPIPAHAPDESCGTCAVCVWAQRRIERERRLDADLEANYERYRNGELVSREASE